MLPLAIEKTLYNVHNNTYLDRITKEATEPQIPTSLAPASLTSWHCEAQTEL